MKEKRIIITLCLFLISCNIGAQDGTKTFVLDMGVPNSLSLSAKGNSKHQRQIQTRQLLGFELKNANPFRYDYTLGYNELDFFEDKKEVSSSEPIKDAEEKKDSMELLNPITKEEILNSLKLYKDSLKELSSSIKAYVNKLSLQESLPMDDFAKQKTEFNKEYLTLIKGINKLSEEASGIPYFIKEFNSYLAKLKTEAKKTNEVLSQLEIKMDYYLHPIDFDGENIDAIELTLKRFNKTTKKEEEPYSYLIWVSGGVKIDVSAGLFLTSLVNKKYEKEDINTDTGETRQVIHEIGSGDYQLGFGSMLNVSYRLGRSWIKPAVSFGAIFKEDSRFQILSGIGAVLGKKSRFIFHYGISMGQIETLNNRYIADGSSQYMLADGAIPTRQKFSFGHFFGLTYNLSKVKTEVLTKK